MLIKLGLLMTYLLLLSCDGILRCSQINRPINLDYYITQTCTTSGRNIIGQTYAEDLEYCKNFSARLRGLGFNFALPENFESHRSNCIVYDCPEFNITALKQYNSMFHYYSLYARILPPENMTCVPREGIFMYFDEKQNYTNAADKCEEYGGTLANIMSEELTSKIANVLMKFRMARNKTIQAYVGMNDLEQEGVFLNVNDEPLNCVPFRSWAPGEPRSRYADEDCVTIDSNRYWRVQECNKTFPFVCEILPYGPLNITQAYCTNIEQQAVKKECVNYYASAEIDFESETCNRTEEDIEPSPATT